MENAAKLRLGPLLATAAVTAAILFGGWFAYQYYGIERPLDKYANALPGVEAADVNTRSGEVVIDLRLGPDAELAELYASLRRKSGGAFGAAKLEIRTEALSNDRLEQAWDYALFDVAEAMENRKYAGVRSAMERLESEFAGLTVVTSIDDNNVYITLRAGDAAKFVVLPREPQMLGVWPDA